MTVFVNLTVVMVHSRSPSGAWNHAQRSRSRGFLPPPPPPPVFRGVEAQEPRVFSHWDDAIVEVGTQTAVCQSSSGDFLATINRALQIIELQCQKPRTISLDALVPTPANVTPPCVPVPASVVLPIASDEITDTLEKQIATLQATVCQSEERIAVLENHINRISATVCQNGTDHDLIILGISQLEDRIQEDVMTNEERLTSLEIAAKCGSKPEEFYIGADVDFFAAALDDIDEEECLAVLGMEDAPLALKEVSYYGDYTGEEFTANTDDGEPTEEEPVPFTAAQHIILDRDINATVMKILDPFIDMIIAKVVVLIETKVKTTIDPICNDLSCRLDALQGERSDWKARAGRVQGRNHFTAEDEEGPIPAAQHRLDNDFRLIVQTSMKRYCFKHNMHGGVLGHVEADLAHNPLMQMQDNSLQIDQLHVENSSELVRYFEKMVEDEVSACNSSSKKKKKVKKKKIHIAPFLSDSNLMQPNQIDTGETLHDCTDFDELKNDFHSTAASAQLLRQTLPGSLGPTQ